MGEEPGDVDEEEQAECSCAGRGCALEVDFCEGEEVLFCGFEDGWVGGYAVEDADEED